jgi:hypothetical protein
VDRDTGLVAFSHSGSRLGTGRVVETNKTTEDKVALNGRTINFVTLLHRDVVGLGSEGQDTETHTGESLHVAEDLLTELLSDGDLLLVVLRAVGSAGTNDTLDGTLGEGIELLGAVVLHDHRHALDIGIERQLGNLAELVGGIVAGESETVPVEAGGKHLNGNLGRVTTSMPLTVLLVDGGKVGKGSDLEEGSKSRLALAKELIYGSNNTAGLTTLLEGKLMGLGSRPSDIASGGVERLGGVLNEVGSLTRSPGSTSNHLTLGKSTSLVGANVGNGTKSLEGLEVSDNDISLNHALSTGSHSDSQDDDQTGGNHGQTSGDGIDNDLLRSIEIVGSKDNDGADDGSAEQEKCQSRQLLLERSADVNTEETTNGISKSKSVGLKVSVGLGRAISLALDGTDSAVLLSESSSNGTNLSAGTSSENDTLGAALGDGRGAVGDVDTVTGTSVVFENLIFVLSHREGLASQHGLIGLKVDGLDQSVGIQSAPCQEASAGMHNLPDVSRDRVTDLDFHKITGNDLHRGDNLGVAISDDTGGRRRHGSERVHGLLGRILLEKTNCDVETNDEGDDAALNPRLDTERNGHSQDQHLGKRQSRFHGILRVNRGEEVGVTIDTRPNTKLGSSQAEGQVATSIEICLTGLWRSVGVIQ